MVLWLERCVVCECGATRGCIDYYYSHRRERERRRESRPALFPPPTTHLPKNSFLTPLCAPRPSPPPALLLATTTPTLTSSTITPTSLSPYLYLLSCLSLEISTGSKMSQCFLKIRKYSGFNTIGAIGGGNKPISRN